MCVVFLAAPRQANIPLLRFRRLTHNLGCLGVVLPGEHLERLGAASLLELGFAHDLIGDQT